MGLFSSGGPSGWLSVLVLGATLAGQLHARGGCSSVLASQCTCTWSVHLLQSVNFAHSRLSRMHDSVCWLVVGLLPARRSRLHSSFASQLLADCRSTQRHTGHDGTGAPTSSPPSSRSRPAAVVEHQRAACAASDARLWARPAAHFWHNSTGSAGQHTSPPDTRALQDTV